jgi:1,4-dihydroxy-2-naphthoate polyprenyltransferase
MKEDENMSDNTTSDIQYTAEVADANLSLPPHREPTWRIWWKLLRPFTLTASIIPVLIGTAAALHIGELDWMLFAAMLAASILIQSATNMFNEYYDFKRGLDTKESVGIGGAIVRYCVQPRTVLITGAILFAASVLLGVYICMQSSWWIAVIGSLSMAAGYFYTGGPYPIAYTPFGELVSGLFMGIVIILITFYIQTGTLTVESFLISIPISVLVGAILMANNIRDLDGDREKGRRTLAIILGRKKAIRCLAFMFCIAYGWTLTLVLSTEISPWLLLVLISIPKAIQAVKRFKGKTVPIQMMPAMKATAALHGLFGILLSAGLLFSSLFPS